MLRFSTRRAPWLTTRCLFLNTLLDVRPTAVIDDVRDAPDGACLLPDPKPY
jgi:hypothetical protein